MAAFKSSGLGLGTKLGAGSMGVGTKGDVNTYLKTLKKKQREANQKLEKDGHKSPEKKKKQHYKNEEPRGKYSFSDDSDLASLAREFEEEEHFQDSPFIRKPTKKTSTESVGSVTTPLPDQEIPFVSSFRKKDQQQQQNTSSTALDNFMKFDEKYSKKLEAVVAGTVTTDEEESMGMPPGGGDSHHPSSAKSPIKIASILEEKITRRNSRASNSNNSVSPSPRSPRGPSRLRRQAEKAGLSRLSIPGAPSLSQRRMDHSPVPTTASEISEMSGQHSMTGGGPADGGLDSASLLSPTFSPLFSIENLHDVDELDDIPLDDANAAAAAQPLQLKATSPEQHHNRERKESVPNLFFTFDVEDVRKESGGGSLEDIDEEEDLVIGEEDEDSDTIKDVVQEEEEVVGQPEAADRRSSQETVIVAAATAAQQSKLRDEQLIEDQSSLIEAKVPKLKLSKPKHKMHESESSDPPSSRDPPRYHRSRRPSRAPHEEPPPKCPMCHSLCDYHKKKRHKRRRRNHQREDRPSIPADRHYLFDPTKDLLHNMGGGGGGGSTASALAKLFLTTSPAAAAAQDEVKGPYMGSIGMTAADPLGQALSEMLRGQLDLTSSFLESQKRLYATYCASLNAVVVSTNTGKAAVDAVSQKRKEVSTTASRLKTKKNDNAGVALEKPTAQACGEEDLSYAYESEFESDSDSPTD